MFAFCAATKRRIIAHDAVDAGLDKQAHVRGWLTVSTPLANLSFALRSAARASPDRRGRRAGVPRFPPRVEWFLELAVIEQTGHQRGFDFAHRVQDTGVKEITTVRGISPDSRNDAISACSPPHEPLGFSSR